MPEQRPGGIFVPLAHPLDAGGHVEIELWQVAHGRNHAIMGYDRLAREWLHEKASGLGGVRYPGPGFPPPTRVTLR